MLSQFRPGATQARDAALKTWYGADPAPTLVAGHEGRVYELGPPVPADDVDGRMPAVLAWCDGARFYLLASTQLQAADLAPVADSLYARK